MDIFSLSARLEIDKSEYERGIKEAKTSFSDFERHAVNVAKTIAGAWAFKEAINGIKQLTTAAVGAYAEYEQLAGGVETLFHTSADTIKEYAQQAYATAGMSANQYMQTVMSFSSSLIRGAASSAQESTRITQEAADEQYEAMKDSLDRQLTAYKRAQEDQYNALKTSLDKRYNALKKSLDKQYKAQSQAIEDEIEAYSDSLQQRQEALQEAQEAETKALQDAIEKRIAAVDKEYENTIKRIDQERSARIAAIDEELKALDDEAKAKEKAAKDEERANTKQRLEQAVQWAQTAAERINAQNKLDDFLEKTRLEDEADERKQHIEDLKEQKNQINDEAKNEEKAAKEKRDKSVNAIKKQGDAELAALRKSQQAQTRALQNSNNQQLKQFRRAKQAQLEALRESQQAQLDAQSDANEKELTDYKRAQQDKLDAQKDAQDKQLKEYKKALKEQQNASSGFADMAADDYQRAAEMANIAITDMSDNANKFGTDMAAIQAAYSGFSRQNFTMLDNLKLGYAGTKEGMEDLLKDAEKITGKKYDINNLMDIYEAIHVIQVEMGIAGTTAQEASSTIEGSANSTKAAWQNLMLAIGSGEDVKQAFDNFYGSAIQTINNIIPVLKRIVPAAGEALKEAGQKLIDTLPEILGQISPEMQTFAENMFSALPGAIDTIRTALEGAFGVIETIYNTVIKPTFAAIVSYIETDIVPVINTIWTDYLQPLQNKIQALWDDHLKDIFEKVGEWIGQNLPDVLRKLEPVISAAAGAFIAFSAAMSISHLISDVVSAFNTLKKTISGIFAFGAAHPVGLALIIIGALAGAFVSLYNSNEEFRAKVDEVWGKVKEAFSGAWQAIKPKLVALKTWLDENIPAALAVAEEKFNWLKDNVLQPVAEFLGGAFSTAWDGIQTFFSETLPAFMTTAGAALDTFRKDFLEPIGTYVGETLLSVWEDLKTFFVETLQPKLTELGEAFSGFLETLKPLGDFLADTFKNAWEGLKSIFSSENFDMNGYVNTLSERFGSLLEALKPVGDFLRKTLNLAFGVLKRQLQGVIEFLTSVFEGDWKGAWDAISSTFADIFGSIVDAAKTPINKVIGFMNGLISKVRDALNTIIDFINNSLSITVPTIHLDWNPFNNQQFATADYENPMWKWSPNISRINWGDQTIPLLAEGGIVKNGGHAIVGEGGYPEYLRVVNGQAVVTPMKHAASTDDVTINIYQQPGQNARELAALVQRELVRWERQRKAAMV